MRKPSIPYSSLTSRREFLKRVGQGVALGALTSTVSGCDSSDTRLPFPGRIVGEDLALCHTFREGALDTAEVEPDPHLYDVIIIGGGVSGLAVAWKLARCGVTNFLVLERADQLGGTCIAEEDGETVFPWGAHYIESPLPSSRHLLEIGEDLGIILEYNDAGWPIVEPNYVVPEPEVSLRAGKKWRPGHFPIEIATSSEVVEFERFRQMLYRWVKWRDADGRPAFGNPNATTSPTEEVRQLDRMTMLEYLDSLDICSEPVRWYVNNRMLDEYGCCIHNVSAWAGVQFWAQSNSSFMDFELPGAPAPVLLSWPEGNAFLVKGLANGLTPEQIRRNTLAIRIRNDRDRVLVTTVGPDASQRRTLQTKWVVHTTPKNSVYRLIPELKQAGRTEFEICEYVPWVTAAVHLRELPNRSDHPAAWEVLMHNVWGLGYIDSLHMRHRAGRLGVPTVLTFYAALGADVQAERYELFRGDWEYWARRIVLVLEQMHPNISDLIIRLDVFRWGHAMVAMRPGYLWGPERQQMQQPFGRIHFAGVDVAGTPVFEQATYRSIEVAQTVMDLLGVTYSSSI